MTKVPSFVKKTLRISGSRHSALYKARGRIAMISVAFVLAYILVAARVFDLSIIQNSQHVPADYGQFAEAPVPEHFRADIVDRNGVILATSLETASLYADPAKIQNPQQVARELSARLPDLVYGDVLRRLQRNGHFIWIKRNLTPDEQFKVLELGHPGLEFKAERRRIYPQGHLAAHLVGYTDVDGNGLAGIERSFDKLLAKGGDPLALTLDIRLQYILYREVKAALDEFGGKGAAGAILDISSGEVLAGVSLPDFDPHNPGPPDNGALFNRLTLGTYELGSTFKIFSTAAMLETHEVSLSHEFDATKPIRRGGFTISDFHPEKRFLTIPEIFMLSSNIGAALMGEMIGTERLKAFYRDLGLMDKMPLEIDEVGSPLLPDVWRDVTTLTASYGHGIAVTPLQMVVAAASIVNGGVAVKPTLILGKNMAKKSENDPKVRVVSPETAHRMRQLMRLVVTEGTGKNADVPGYNVGGKTGTAEKADAGGYARHKQISSFIGFFPMDAPRYAVFVMVDEPHGTKKTWGYATGGWVAAPAVGRIIKSMAAVLGIPPEKNGKQDDIAAPLQIYVHYKKEGDPGATY